jgi:hypothetical protein
MESSMKGNGRMGLEMEKDYGNLLMENAIILENGRRIKLMDLVHIIGRMVSNYLLNLL